MPTLKQWAGHRRESWRWDLLDNQDRLVRTLDGVVGGKVDMSIFDTIRSGGSLSFENTTKAAARLLVPDWSISRVQPWYTVTFPDGTVDSTPWGVFLCAAPKSKHSDGKISTDVQLFDKLLILVQDCVEEMYSLPIGTIVTDTVWSLISTSAGGSSIGVKPSTETLRTAMFWEAGTTKLKIINDLLASINYFSLWVDGYGVFQALPYAAPAARPQDWSFLDDENSVYLPDFDHERDTYDVPNKVIVIGETNGDLPALVGVATNENPASPTSYQARGRWVTRVDTGVEATSQGVADAVAARRLVEASQVSSQVEIDHAIVPISLNSSVIFRRNPAGIRMTATVQKMSVATTPGSLVQTTLQEVAA